MSDIKEMEATEEILSVYSPLKEFLSEEDYQKKCSELMLMEVVLDQVNLIFKERVINTDEEMMVTNVDNYKQQLIDRVREEYLRLSKEAGAAVDIPDMGTIVSWVESIYYDIFQQLFNKELVDLVIAPSLEDISNAIIEYSKEPEEELEEELEEEKEEEC